LSQRIYVHESVYDDFVAKFVEKVKVSLSPHCSESQHLCSQKFKLGDPTRLDVTLGPVVSVASAERIKKQIADAVAAGAKALIPPEPFRVARQP
jgi:acyl-CoA reductase-like NAD-dependent aldehyde dehydrogenase